VDLSANDVREVRFGTTRIRAGYDISEVDEFLDRVEKSIAEYTDNYRRVQDEAEALRSQVQQIQGRLEAIQAEQAERDELEEARSQPMDPDSTAENPVVVLAPTGAESTEALDGLRRIRDDVRHMLQRQLELVDSVQVPGVPDAPDAPDSPDSPDSMR